MLHISAGPVIGIGTPLGAGAFLTHFTTAIILMGITLGIGTDLVIPSTGVGTHIGAGAFLTCTRTTAFILNWYYPSHRYAYDYYNCSVSRRRFF